ncbi:hypothetical protein KY361_04205 [Candidatus Woesearchaeota archaeon]|nr:hypothetical protein [Candidatus Woesearchaeota archaeon]
MAVVDEIIKALNEIGYSFVKDSSLWWYLAPVILLWIALEIYFGKYKKEQLGWNTSLGNAVTLTWISVESMRFLFETQPGNFWFRFGIIMAIMFYALLIIYFSFSHKISAKATYTLASPNAIYFLCMVTILWGHGALKLTEWVLLDLVILYIILLILFGFIRMILPEAKKEKEEPPGLEGIGKEEGLGGLGGLGGGKEDLGVPDLGKGMDLGKDFKF